MKLIVSSLDGGKTIKCQFQSIIAKTVDKDIILTEIRTAMIINVRIDWFNNFAFNCLTDLTPFIMFFILTLLHTVIEVGMYGLLYIPTYSL